LCSVKPLDEQQFFMIELPKTTNTNWQTLPFGQKFCGHCIILIGSFLNNQNDLVGNGLIYIDPKWKRLVN